MGRILAVTILLAAACSDSSTVATLEGGPPGTVCEPSGEIDGVWSSTAFEDVEAHLTGYRVTAENEGDAKPDDPVFGGTWGDRRGGMIVGVTDCAAVDLDEITRIGGGSDRVTIITVLTSEQGHHRALGELVERLDAAGVDPTVTTDWTAEGPFVTVHTIHPDRVPDDVGDGLPLRFEVVEGFRFSDDTEAIG